MRKVMLIVEQIEEARRLLGVGSVPSLRMALLLLDNAAEVLMHRAIEDDFVHDQFYRRMYATAQAVRPDASIEEIREVIGHDFIPRTRKNAVRRFFDEKVRFLCEHTNALDSATADALSALHRYRNQAQHQDKIRADILRPVVLVLYEITCHLLVVLPPGTTTYHGEDDWSEISEKYGIDKFGIGENALEKIRAVLLEGLPLSTAELSASLRQHLDKRLDAVFDALHFIADNSRDIDTIEKALYDVQQWDVDEREAPYDLERKDHPVVPHYSASSLEALRHAIGLIQESASNRDLLQRFARIEGELEPIEQVALTCAGHLDAAIQFEIDRLRGK